MKTKIYLVNTPGEIKNTMWVLDINLAYTEIRNVKGNIDKMGVKYFFLCFLCFIILQRFIRVLQSFIFLPPSFFLCILFFFLHFFPFFVSFTFLPSPSLPSPSLQALPSSLSRITQIIITQEGANMVCHFVLIDECTEDNLNLKKQRSEA